jgi:hypothetical protein
MRNDSDPKFEKKIFKIGRTAAYSIGGAIGCWFLNLIYPYPEDARHIAAVLGAMAWVLLGYGALMLGLILLNKRLAPLVNLVMIAIVIPSAVLYILMAHWPH